MDQCTHCTMRGNLRGCMETPCGQHENWMTIELRAEVERLREVAKAALRYDKAIQVCANSPEKMASFCSAEGDDLDALYADWLQKARDALTPNTRISRPCKDCKCTDGQKNTQ